MHIINRYCFIINAYVIITLFYEKGLVIVFKHNLSMVQITHNLNDTQMSHVCDTRGANHTHVCFLDTTRVCTHMQYIHMRMFLQVCMLAWVLHVAS